MAALVSWSSMIGLRRIGGRASAAGVDAASSESNCSRSTIRTSMTATSVAAAQSTSRWTSETGLAGPLTDDDDDDDNRDEQLTSLMVACRDEQLGIVKKLIRRGNTQLKAIDGRGRTALHHAIDNRSTKVIAALLNADLSLLDVEDADGNTALLLAAIAGNNVIVKFLLKLGADVRTRDSQQRTTVHWASQCGHWDLIDVLSSSGAHLSDTDCYGASPLHYVAQMCGAAMDDEGQYHATSLRVLDRLVANGAQVDCIDQDLRTPLFWAAGSGSPEACQALLKAGANVKSQDKDGLTALHFAAARGHQLCIDMLLRHGADVGATDYSGCIPLMYSVSLGHLGSTRNLLVKNSNPNHRDNRGRSPAHWAATKGSVECLKLLRNQGGNLWTTNDGGDYPIHEAALAQQNDAVRYLAAAANRRHSAGPERYGVDVPGVDGRTCLHIAAMTNNIALVTFLVDNDANKEAIMTCQDNPLSAYDAAMIKNHCECAEFLRLCGVKSANPKLYENDEDDDEQDNVSMTCHQEHSTKATDEEHCVGFVNSTPPLQHVIRDVTTLPGASISQRVDDGGLDGGCGMVEDGERDNDNGLSQSKSGTDEALAVTADKLEELRFDGTNSKCSAITAEVEEDHIEADAVLRGVLDGAHDGDVFGVDGDVTAEAAVTHHVVASPGDLDEGASRREPTDESGVEGSASGGTSIGMPLQREAIQAARSDTAVQTGELRDEGDTWRRRTNDKYVQTEQPFESMTLTECPIDSHTTSDVVLFETSPDDYGDERECVPEPEGSARDVSATTAFGTADVLTTTTTMVMSDDGSHARISHRDRSDVVQRGTGIDGVTGKTGDESRCADRVNGLDWPGSIAGDSHVEWAASSSASQRQNDGASRDAVNGTESTVRRPVVAVTGEPDADADGRVGIGNGGKRTVERRSRIIGWRKKCDVVSRSVQTTLSSFPEKVGDDTTETLECNDNGHNGDGIEDDDDDCVFYGSENVMRNASQVDLSSSADGGGRQSRSRTRMKRQHWDKQLEYIMFYSASDDSDVDDDYDARSRRRRHRPHSVGSAGRALVPLPRPFGSSYLRRSHSVVAPRLEMRCRLRALRRSLPGVAVSSWEGWTYATAMRRQLEHAELQRRRRRRERRRRSWSSAAEDDEHGTSRFLDYGYTKREREQMRIYGVRKEGTAAELVLLANRLQQKSASKSSTGVVGGADSRPESVTDDRQTIARWLISGKNLIQEYVRIFETRRLVTIVLQRARKMRMRCRNSSRAVETTCTRQLVAEYNRMAKAESRVEETDFESINDFRRLLLDELLRVSEEEKYLKKIEKLLHLLPVDELDASITDYYSRASPRSTSISSPSAVSITGSGQLPRQTDTNDVGSVGAKKADGLSMNWLKNALAVDDAATRRWSRRYHRHHHHQLHQPKSHQPVDGNSQPNSTISINWLRPMYVPECVKGSVQQSRAPHLQSSLTLPRVLTGKHVTGAAQSRRCQEGRSAGPHQSPYRAAVKTLPPIMLGGTGELMMAATAKKLTMGDRSAHLPYSKTNTFISQLGHCGKGNHSPVRLPVLQQQSSHVALPTTTSAGERRAPHQKYGNSTMPSQNATKFRSGASTP